MTTLEVVSMTVGGGGAAIIVRELFIWLRGRTSDQQTHDRLSRQDTRQEFQELYERQQKEIDELQKRDDKCREELGKLWRRFERMSAWLLYLESELVRAKIPFRPYVESPSEEHDRLGSAA